MKSGPLILMLCVVVESFLQTWGKELYMNRTEGNLYDQLTCSLETDQRDQTILSFIDISIVDYTHPRNKLKLASASVLQPDLYVQYSRNINMKVSGSVSQYQAKLDIEFSKHSRCDQGSFLCEVTFINLAGRIDKIHAAVKAKVPDDISNDGSDTSELILVDELTELSNQLSFAAQQMNNTTNHTTDTVNRLVDTTKELTDLKSHLNITINMLADRENKLIDVKNQMNLTTIHLNDSNYHLADTTNQLNDKVNHMTDTMSLITSRTEKIEEALIQLTGHFTSTEMTLADVKNHTNVAVSQLMDREKEIKDVNKQLNLLTNRTEKIEETLIELAGRFTTIELALANMPSLLVKSQQENQNECYRGMASKTTVPRIPVLVLDTYTALCDAWTDGGGWIIIQRRTDGGVDFYRGWKEYKRGFGDLTSDYWLGNEAIHALTLGGNFELRVDMTFKERKYYAQYRTFIVGSESTNYKLTLDGYSGDAGDNFMYHNNMQFSTKDRDYDVDSRNCAVKYGAWWYKTCHYVNLNGKWGGEEHKGLRWSGVTGVLSVDSSEMKIRLT